MTADEAEYEARRGVLRTPFKMPSRCVLNGLACRFSGSGRPEREREYGSDEW
jgi:hypothetical protein